MANYLNRPSIFEIATAYEEPRTNEKNYVDKKIGYLCNDYKNISPSEKRFTVMHPYLEQDSL